MADTALTEFPFARHGDHLIASTEEASAALSEIREGREVLVSFRTPRNIRHHKLFFAILKFLQYHSLRFENVPVEKIKDAVKLATGLADTFIDADTGKTYYVLRSISFAAMSQHDFREFFDEAVKVIAHRWMPEGTTPEAVRKQLFEMVDGPGAIGSRVA